MIYNRLFSQERKKRNTEAWSSGNLWNPSTFDILWAIHHVSDGCKESLFCHFTVLILLHPLLTLPHFSCFSPIILGHSWSFSSVMKTSTVYICKSVMWSANWPGCSPQHWGFSGLSHSAVQGITIAIARGRWDLALQSGKVWSSPGRNGTASTFHTSLGVTTNFLYCIFDWKHIWNIFSSSHLCTQKKKGYEKI